MPLLGFIGYPPFIWECYRHLGIDQMGVCRVIRGGSSCSDFEIHSGACISSTDLFMQILRDRILRYMTELAEFNSKKLHEGRNTLVHRAVRISDGKPVVLRFCRDGAPPRNARAVQTGI